MSETNNKGYNLPTVGGDFNTWGNLLNTNWSLVDVNIGGAVSVSVSGNTDFIPTAAQSSNLYQAIVGALTGNINYFLPRVGGFYFIGNFTTGGFNLTVQLGTGGEFFTVPQGNVQLLVSDGVNIFTPSTLNSNAAISGRWNDVSGSRALGVNGTNALGKPIAISVNVNSTGTESPGLTGVVNGGDIVVMPFGSGITNIQLIVPTGGIYRIDANGVFSPSLISWLEFF